MRDSDWSRQILLRSDWLPTSVAPITTGLFHAEFLLNRRKLCLQRLYNSYL